ncbi:MAG: DUF4190 domain-containing protein [Pseudonocardiales bacterium]|nr:DUF4190 domain-containing protein [Pseudonocardiales bacterium]
MNTPGDPRNGQQYSPPVDYGQNPAEYAQGSASGAGYGAPPAPPRNGFGVAALVLGLLALLVSWTVIGGIILGALALIFGLLGQARAKRGEATNGGMSIAGVVLGIIGLLIAIGLIVLGVSLLNSPMGKNYQQCIQQSGGDQVKVQQCVSEFGRQLQGR